MRISDWSSDVCSSDLRIPAARQHAGAVNDADQRIGLREIAPQLAIAEIHVLGQQAGGGAVREHRFEQLARLIRPSAQVQDRTSVVYGKSVSVRVDLGVGRILKKNTSNNI